MEVMCSTKNVGPSVRARKLLHLASSPAVFILVLPSLDFVWGRGSWDPHKPKLHCNIFPPPVLRPTTKSPTNPFDSAQIFTVHISRIHSYIILAYAFWASSLSLSKWFPSRAWGSHDAWPEVVLPGVWSNVAYFPVICHGPQKNDMSINPVVAVGTCLPSCCLATIGGIRMRTHRLMGGSYKVHCWDGSGAMIYIPSFIKTGSGI
jgi:hypothetical protein